MTKVIKLEKIKETIYYEVKGYEKSNEYITVRISVESSQGKDREDIEKMIVEAVNNNG